jgi:hypothetical protein
MGQMKSTEQGLRDELNIVTLMLNKAVSDLMDAPDGLDNIERLKTQVIRLRNRRKQIMDNITALS